MKYIAPKYEISVIETEDILTTSTNQASKYEVEEKGDGNGNVIMNALDIFR